MVKGSGVYHKNPAQHAADFEMLEKTEALKPTLVNPATNDRKVIEGIRVDGATDKGPSHLEVQFWWTLRNLRKPTFANLVTSRCSDCSYLNRVELRNGCLALAHSHPLKPEWIVFRF